MPALPASRTEPPIAWPSRECWSAFGYCYALLTLLWLIVYGGACWVTSLHSYRVELQVDADLAMPFVPLAAVVYLSLFPMTWLAPFVLGTPEGIRLFARALAVLYVCSGLGFLLIPMEEVRSIPTMDGVAGHIFRFADWINLSHNYFPSLHVGITVLCACLYWQQSGARIGLLTLLWALAISVSTLLTHQHYVVDVASGAGLAVLVSKYHRLLPIPGLR